MSGGVAGVWRPIQQHLLPCTSCALGTPHPPSSTRSALADPVLQLAETMQASAARTRSALAALRSIHAPAQTQGVPHPATGMPTSAEARQPSLIVPIAAASSPPPGLPLRKADSGGADHSLREWVDVGMIPDWAGRMGSRMPAWMMHDERGVIGQHMRQLAAALHLPCYGEALRHTVHAGFVHMHGLTCHCDCHRVACLLKLSLPSDQAPPIRPPSPTGCVSLS